MNVETSLRDDAAARIARVFLRLGNVRLLHRGKILPFLLVLLILFKHDIRFQLDGTCRRCFTIWQYTLKQAQAHFKSI